MSAAFRRVWVDHAVSRGSAIIYWELDPNFRDPGPWTFQAQWGRTVNNTWTDVTVAPVQDSYFTIDPLGHLYAKQIDLYYRVRVTTGLGRTFYSDPTRADGGMPWRDWCIAREIVRKEYLNCLKNPDGIKCCLLKRRVWGDRCRTSTDWDTGEVTKPGCLECFDTGIVGGYYKALEYWVINMPKTQRLARDDNRATTGDVTIKVRGVAYPHIESNDVLVKSDTNERYVIETVEEATKIRTRPIVLNLTLRLAPESNILYDFPLEACGIGGSGRGPTDPCKPTTVLSDESLIPEYCLPPIPEG